MTDYESPFIIPKEHQCSRPNDHSQYRTSHEANTGSSLWGRECPVHGPTAREFARSHHMTWYRAREEYATAKTDAARERAMNYMLHYVSETCPPDVPYKESHLPKPEKTSHANINAIFATVLIVYGLFMVVSVAVGFL